nr:MAG TPA: hypothetical protein [Caudoviricetes sp.]
MRIFLREKLQNPVLSRVRANKRYCAAFCGI